MKNIKVFDDIHKRKKSSRHMHDPTMHIHQINIDGVMEGKSTPHRRKLGMWFCFSFLFPF